MDQVLQAAGLWALPAAALWLFLLPGILMAVARCRDAGEVLERAPVRMACAVAASLCLCYALLIAGEAVPRAAGVLHAAYLALPTVLLAARRRLRAKALRFVLLCSDVQAPLLMMAGLTTFRLGQAANAAAPGAQPLQLAVRLALSPLGAPLAVDLMLQSLWIPAVWLVLRLLGAGRRHAVTAIVTTACAGLATSYGVLDSPAVTAGAAWLVAVAALLWLPDGRSRLLLASTGFAFAMLSHAASAFAIVALLVMVPRLGTRLSLGDWCRVSGVAFGIYAPWLALHGSGIGRVGAASLAAAAAGAALAAWVQRTRREGGRAAGPGEAPACQPLPEALRLAVTALLLALGVRLVQGADAASGLPAGAFLLLLLVGSAAAAKLPRPFWRALIWAQAAALLAITAHGAQGVHGAVAWMTLPGAASLALSPWAGAGKAPHGE